MLFDGFTEWLKPRIHMPLDSLLQPFMVEQFAIDSKAIATGGQCNQILLEFLVVLLQFGLQ